MRPITFIGVLVLSMGVALGQPAKVATRPRISVGITVVSLNEARELWKLNPQLPKNLPNLQGGIFVANLIPEGGFGKAGVKAGDIITRIGSLAVRDTGTFNAWYAGVEVGRQYSIAVLRSSERNGRIEWRPQTILLVTEKAATEQWKEWENEQVQIDAEDRPFELKGDRLGMPLGMFKAKYYRAMPNDPRPAPFCSDTNSERDNAGLLYRGEYGKAGIVHATGDMRAASWHPGSARGQRSLACGLRRRQDHAQSISLAGSASWPGRGFELNLRPMGRYCRHPCHRRRPRAYRCGRTWGCDRCDRCDECVTGSVTGERCTPVTPWKRAFRPLIRGLFGF